MLESIVFFSPSFSPLSIFSLSASILPFTASKRICKVAPSSPKVSIEMLKKSILLNEFIDSPFANSSTSVSSKPAIVLPHA